jgi:cytochrome b6-f complex iron-sulfur subunit
MGIQQLPKMTPQQYEVMTGGGAEAGEVARRGLSRRQVLRRAVGGVLGLLGLEVAGGTLAMLYPNLTGQFGSDIAVGKKKDFPAAVPKAFILGSAGVFYEQQARAYIIHLAKDTPFIIKPSAFTDQIDSEWWVQDTDGSYWIALYQKCVHLGCKVPYRDDCDSFKCPCHGSHYNVDGEYLDGPAPRSLDRFKLVIGSDGSLTVQTGQLNQHVQRPSTATRVIAPPSIPCSAT